MRKYRVYINSVGYNINASNKERAMKKALYWWFHDSTNFTAGNLKHRRSDAVGKEDRVTIFCKRED
jgi:hypothetical protein